MLIKEVVLNNIRSYVSQKISFNNDIVVLSGDIGSGKSTILLAVEFALFGITDSAGSLLRKGANEGSVELRFEVNNKEYTVKRFLKRKSEGVRQENTYIIHNEIKKEMTPTELKHFVVGLLGYPQESLNKKSTVYRYTTYTPQDEMKAILFGDVEERLDIIRKIFGIDRYKRIIENSSLFARNLREKIRELTGKTADLEAKKLELKKINDEKAVLAAKEKEEDEKLAKAKNVLEEIRKKLIFMETEMKKSHDIKREKAEIEYSLKHKLEQRDLLKREAKRAEDDVVILSEKASAERLERLKKKIKTGLKEDILNLEREQLNLQKQIGEFEALKKHSEERKNRINELQKCPLCEQDVPHTHKAKISLSEEEKLADLKKNLVGVNKKIDAIKLMIEEKQKELNETNAAEKEYSVIELYLKNINEKELFIKEKKELEKKLNDEINALREKNESIKPAEFDEKRYTEVKNEFENCQKAERIIELEKARIAAEIKNNEKLEVMFRDEIKQKENEKLKLGETAKLENWLQNNFVNIIAMMEKHVLSSIYYTFNDTFKEMLEVLIDDERITARISNDFTPIVEQNSYETEFESLSGGEKTSVSMAYRLALHKALNDISSSIQTKGLLILDEPTDGFSSEQIDKMKDLFEKLDTQQTIIVSHENKIESIADHVVRVVKTGHESTVFP